MSDERPQRTEVLAGPCEQALECLLFAAKEPVTIQRLAEALQVETTELPRLLEALATALEGRGIQLVQLAGGYSLATRPEYAEHVQRLLEPASERLSIQALETLAIIAYRQPITRPEIDEVRGVNSSATVTGLLEKDLVRIAGRRDAPGRPFLLATTPRFLSVFGLSDLDDLPDIGELQRRLERQVPLASQDGGEMDEGPGIADTITADGLDVGNHGESDEASVTYTGGQAL